MRENYFKKEEIFTLQIPTRKYRKPKINKKGDLFQVVKCI